MDQLAGVVIQATNYIASCIMHVYTLGALWAGTMLVWKLAETLRCIEYFKHDSTSGRIMSVAQTAVLIAGLILLLLLTY